MKKEAAIDAPFDITRAHTARPSAEFDESLYSNCTSERSVSDIAKYIHYPELWLKHFNSDGQQKAMRVLVQICTVDAVLRGKYWLPDGSCVTLNKKHTDRACIETKCYASDFPFPKSFSVMFPPQPPVLVRGDCLDACLELTGGAACVLNMASAGHPGGGYRRGAAAQEEGLCRRSALWYCLEDPYKIDTSRQWSYPLAEFGGLYSKNVPVFRRSESSGYAFLPKPQKVSFVSVAAYSNPPVETNANGDMVLSKSIAQHTRRKMTAILSIALLEGHDSIVLSALGCGAYANPPKDIARLFKEVLQTFEGCFRQVIIAVIDDRNSYKPHNPSGNIVPFEEIFQQKAKYI